MQEKKNNELSALRRVVSCEYPYINEPNRASFSVANYYEIIDYDCLGDEEIKKECKNEDKKNY